MRDLKDAGDRFFLAYIQAATFEQLERTVSEVQESDGGE